MAGIGTRLLKIVVAGTEYSAQVSTSKVTTGESDSDFITFADAAAGGARQYNFEFTAVQDLTVGTLWDKVWSVPGTLVACTLKPYGNATATPSQPWYTFNAVVTEPDGDFIGGDADKSVTAQQTINCVWPCDAKPVKVTS
jgi:hypothetical protein